MALLISQGQHRRQALSEAEEPKLKASRSPAEERGVGSDGDGNGIIGSRVTSQLYLSKPPSSDAASSLEKDAVLRRIRRHRRVHRVRTAFESILGGASAEEPHEDAFSSP